MKKITNILFIQGLFLLLATAVFAGSVLHFSDITSGPKKDLDDGKGSGVIVSVWGTGFGSSQGKSKIYIGDQEAAYVYYWGPADGSALAGPADLTTYHKMQTISFSVPASATDGATTIKVVSDGVASNTLSFTVRKGDILHVKTTGSDISWCGSWNRPCRTLNYAINSKASAGDTIYVHDKVTEASGVQIGFPSDKVGSASMPFVLIAYPGAVATITNTYSDGKYSGIKNYNLGSKHWTFSKLLIKAVGNGIACFTGLRAVANELTEEPGKCISGQTGVLGSGGASFFKNACSDMKYYGNYAHNTGCDKGTKMMHVFYISNRTGSKIGGAELGWNYLKDNKTNHGLHIYDESACGDWSSPILVHDNVVANQRGWGFGMNIMCSSGTVHQDVKVYNNLIVNSGLGPAFPDGGYNGTAVYIGGSANQSNIYFYNNTIYGYSDTSSGENFKGAISISKKFGGKVFYFNNIVVDTKGINYQETGYDKAADEHSNNLWYSTVKKKSPPYWDTAPINADPRFKNSAQGDFGLEIGSPATKKGTPKTNSVVTKDILGASRSAPSNIGAFE